MLTPDTHSNDGSDNGDDHDAVRARISGFVGVIWLALAIASGAAVYLLHAFMQKTYGVDAFESVCNFGASFDCDRINTSVYGKLLGFPITIFAVPTYVALAALAWLGAAGGDKGRSALRLVQLGAVGAVAYGLFLLYVMMAVEETFCVFCLTMDAASVVVLVASTLALKRLGPIEDKPQLNRSALIAVIVGGALLGLGTVWHDDTRDKLVAEQIAKAQADIEKSKAQVAAKAAEAPADKGAVSTASTAANSGGSDDFKAEKLADNLYKIPVHADDPTFGPADAKVTVIEYADFQCTYCKKLFYHLNTLKERYPGKVRFVFKHFPMNTLCNKTIKNNRHRWACNAALTSECARRQGKFWPIHDLMFKNQHRLEKKDRDFYAHSVGLDLATYGDCMRNAGPPRANLQRTINEAASIGITATPRTFVNGQMLSGAVSAEVIDHFIKQELEKIGDKAPDGPVTKPPMPFQRPPDAPMVAIKKTSGTFYIDVFEASVDDAGRALSLRGVQPANLNWYDAKSACEKAGKRLCTSEEWVSACSGEPAVDNDADGNFANDYVEGNQFPYADYYEEGFCHANADSRTGRPRATGGAPQCRTKAGVYDLAGNVAEWVEATDDKAFLIGGDYRAEERSNCVRSDNSFGPGHRNHSIGFRCCADKMVSNASAKATDAAAPESVVGKKVPELSGTLKDGGKWTTAALHGKVTFLTFFASWCTPCRRELPELAGLLEKYEKMGLAVVAVGVDTDAEKARLFANEVGVKFPVIVDPDAKLLGKFDVQNMPTGYLVDREGVIRHKQVGFGTKTIEDLQPKLKELLKK